MVISAVAVLATLIYTSYLDIRDRRVPFIHWLPMLAVGVICTSVLLWQTTANASLVTGYLALVASFSTRITWTTGAGRILLGSPGSVQIPGCSGTSSL